MKLYLDDVRNAPDDWIVARTAHEAIQLLEQNIFEVVSLDHDLGTDHYTKPNNGYDVICWLEDQVFNHGYPAPFVVVHTANPAAYRKMMQAAKRIISQRS